MGVLRVFPRRTAYTPAGGLVAVGEPDLFLAERRREISPVDEIHVSCVFTWDRERCEQLAEIWSHALGAPARVGGPGTLEAPGEFQPGQYVKHGVTFTSRGCPNACPWCMVPSVEGKLRELEIQQPGHVIQDNNLLACSKRHIKNVFRMLGTQRKAAEFKGGLEVQRLDVWHIELLRDLRGKGKLRELWLAQDAPEVSPRLHGVVSKLRTFLARQRVRCYVLVGYNGETVAHAHKRLDEVWEAGAMPFAQYYRAPTESTWKKPPAEWRSLIRNWSRPALMAAAHEDEE